MSAREAFGRLLAAGHPADHAAAVATLPEATLAIVLDALCVRAMDFVGDRLDNDGESAADIARELVGSDELPIFDPARYFDVLAGIVIGGAA